MDGGLAASVIIPVLVMGFAYGGSSAGRGRGRTERTETSSANARGQHRDLDTRAPQLNAGVRRGLPFVNPISGTVP